MSHSALFDVPQELPLKKRRCTNCRWAVLWSCYFGAAECGKRDFELVPAETGRHCSMWEYGEPKTDGGGGWSPLEQALEVATRT